MPHPALLLPLALLLHPSSSSMPLASGASASSAPVSSTSGPNTDEAARALHVLVFGDSITAGYGLTAAQAFPALVEATARREGLAVRVTGSGVSGETTVGGLARLPRVLDAAGAVDVFVLELGANDAFRGVAPERTEQNLVALVRAVQARHPNARVVVAGMEIPASAWGGYGALASAYSAVFRRAATATGATLVPFLLDGVAGVRAYTLPDRLHPNAEGQRRVAATLWHTLGPLVRQGAPRTV